MISAIDYLKMSKFELYKEYCKAYKYLETICEMEEQRLKAELNAARTDLFMSYIQKPISKGDYYDHILR